jgi:hypothetical protein
MSAPRIPDAAPTGLEPKPGRPAGPTLEQREHLVRLHQERVCRQAESNPLRASIGVLGGDVQMIAHGLAEQITQAIAQNGAAALEEPAVAKSVGDLAKLVRLVSQLAQLERQPAPTDPPSDRLWAGSEKRGF